MKLTNIPVLPLRDIVVFPHMVAPLFVGRKLSINALNYVMAKDKIILLITQKQSEIDNPKPKNLYNIGTIAKILQLLKLPDGTIKVLVEGLEKVEVKNILETEEFIIADCSIIKQDSKLGSKVKALLKLIIDQFESYQKINKNVAIEVVNNVRLYTEPNKIVDIIIANLNINIEQKQELLGMKSTVARLEKLYNYLVSEIDTLQVEKKIKGRVKRQMEKTQKEYYLNEQMKAIQKELGDKEDFDDIKELEKKISEIKFSSEAKDKCKSEINRC